MKSIIPFFLFFGVCTNSKLQAQGYLPFVDQNKTWVNALYTVEPFDEWGEGSYHYVFSLATYYCIEETDTLIEDMEYAIINYCNGVYKGAIRDNEGKVFFIPKDSTEEFLLYDFTVDVGDEISDIIVQYGSYYELIEATVSEVSTIVHEGITRRVVRLGWDYFWIEGIGSTKGLFLNLQTELSDYGHFLNCMSIDGTTYYLEIEGVTELEGACSLSLTVKENKAIDFTIYPNPAIDIVYCDFSTSINIEAVSILTIDGKIIEANWSIYNDGIRISVADLPLGFYYISITAGDKVLNKPVLVQ